MSNELKARVDLATGPAVQALNALSQQFVKLNENSRTSSTRLAQQARSLKAVGSAAASEALAVERFAKAQERLNRAENERRTSNARVANIRANTTNSTAESAGRQALNESRVLTEEVRRRGLIEDQNYKRQQRELQETLRLERQRTEAARQTAREQEAVYNHLASTRYALYDVARIAGIAGAALSAALIIPPVVATSWQAAFADVIRTTGTFTDETGVATQKLKADFVDLAQTIPESWESLTQIGTLAGQLGIPQDEITEFTEIVAKFAATTNVSVEDAGTAFGRLNALLPDVDGNFEGIADSVLKVGVNSIATESQIVRIATQISALGSQAGFSYDEVIGLAGALASVAVPPELARGVVTRVFGQIGRAAQQGGTNLERFAQLSGMTGAEFRKAWSEDAGGTFLRFMKGVQESGGNAEAAIRALGITSVRDVPILIRLANAANSAGEAGGLLAQTFTDAADAAGTLSEQYAVKMETVAAKIQLLVNNFNVLMDTIGGASLGPLGAVLDFLIEKLQQINDFASSPAGATIIGLGIAFTALAAALTLVTAAGATALAGYAALITALRGLSAGAGGATITLSSMNFMLSQTGKTGAAAAAGIRLVGTALKALAAITVVLALPDVANWANGALDGIKGWSNELDAVQGRLTKVGEFFAGTSVIDEFAKHAKDGTEWINGLNRFFANANIGTAASMEIKKLDDGLKALVEGGQIDEANSRLAEMGITGETIGYILPGTADAIKAAASAAGESAPLYGDAALAAGDLATESEEAAQAYSDMLDVYAKGDASFISLTGAIDSARQKQQDFFTTVADGTESADDSWETYYDGQSFNMQQYLTELQAQVDAQTAWEQNMTALAGRVSEETLAELGRLGPEGAPLVAQLVTASDEELQKFDTLFAQAGTDAGTSFAVALATTQTLINDVGATLGSGAKTELLTRLAAGEDFNALLAEYTRRMNGLNMTVPAPSLTPAQRALDDFLYRNNGRTITINTQVVGVRTTVGNGVPGGFGFSRGGYVRGYDVGGYTGDGAKYDPAGIVHRGEFVFDKESTAAYGVSTLYDLMRAGRRGYADGGAVNDTWRAYTGSAQSSSASWSNMDAGSLVELGRAIATALATTNISLYTSDQLIATSANRGNTQLAQQGSK